MCTKNKYHVTRNGKQKNENFADTTLLKTINHLERCPILWLVGI